MDQYIFILILRNRTILRLYSMSYSEKLVSKTKSFGNDHLHIVILRLLQTSTTLFSFIQNHHCGYSIKYISRIQTIISLKDIGIKRLMVGDT